MGVILTTYKSWDDPPSRGFERCSYAPWKKTVAPIGCSLKTPVREIYRSTNVSKICSTKWYQRCMKKSLVQRQDLPENVYFTFFLNGVCFARFRIKVSETISNIGFFCWTFYLFKSWLTQSYHVFFVKTPRSGKKTPKKFVGFSNFFMVKTMGRTVSLPTFGWRWK